MENGDRLLTSEVWRNAIVVFANYAQFTKGRTSGFQSVSSRMLAWCKAGHGSITINGERKELSPSRFVFTPWQHQIEYEASDQDPFLLACCHIIPNHDPDVRVRYAVSHASDDEVAGYTWRQDVHDPLLHGVVEGSAGTCPALESLADYVVRTFVAGRALDGILAGCQREDDGVQADDCLSPAPLLARQFAQLIIREVTHMRTSTRRSALSVPARLSQIMHYIQDRVHSPDRGEEIRQEALSRQFKMSPSTIRRLFMDNLGMSPTEWIIDQRITSAKVILRSSTEPVSVVAAKVGFTDAGYFSKVFRQRTGHPPSEWRSLARWP